MITQAAWMLLTIVFGALCLSTLIAGAVMINKTDNDPEKQKSNKNTGIGLLVTMAISLFIAGYCFYKTRNVSADGTPLLA